ncbi:MAG: mechanosensitive ion channel family protein [Sarcina ventriculi]|uniref:Small-conductance mechanosensitive channel n=1 Tax=Sarcina ventriculi TaxID=1267 RepID=A0ABP2AQE0_SARVE|nr:mechanosensitive ion channel family protein [Sarcina ventriculi]MDO4402009.1 mechanosensitive ion channel family protein [Clostridiaceae bacterium]MCI5635648.1 mechanosensitive ion channel family protein [Sarcina ventriculi]MDD7372260.1 mechanosensitive ion channel family protein [Sarcina ventriculi]MDY7063598.1 mechanosensitive ion channel family protein [Sarcina ventriculi]CUN94205.1 Small-conductance mechanosensitive channel [Sarcina ventriculi]
MENEIKSLTGQSGINFFGITISAETIASVIFKIIMIVIIFILMMIAIRIANKFIDRMVKNQIESNHKFSMDEKKAKTIGILLKSLVKYSVYFLGITSMLSIVFGAISWAFASVGGVAVGLGAQSFIKDMINGIFILFEEQYSVGDYVTIDNSKGIVKAIGLRTTELRDFNGDIYIIPNGSIQVIVNHSKGDMRVLVDIGIAYEADIELAISVINEVCSKYNQENPNITTPIEVLGVTALNDSNVNIRVIGETKPMKQWEAERELMKRIKLEFDKRGIEIPYNKVQVINDN